MVARQRVAPVTIGARSAAAGRFRSRRSALAAASLVAGLAIAGLAPAALAQSGQQPNAKAFQKYRTCMANHGVKLPKNGGFPGGGPPGGSLPSGSLPSGAAPGAGGTPPSGPPAGGSGGLPPTSLPKGVSQKKFNKAQKACRSKLPNGARGGGPNGGGSAEFQAYLSCLGDHGVDVPEPGQSGSNRLPNFGPNDPTFAAANEICGALAPTTSTTQAAT